LTAGVVLEATGAGASSVSFFGFGAAFFVGFSPSLMILAAFLISCFSFLTTTFYLRSFSSFLIIFLATST